MPHFAHKSLHGNKAKPVIGDPVEVNTEKGVYKVGHLKTHSQIAHSVHTPNLQSIEQHKISHSNKTKPIVGYPVKVNKSVHKVGHLKTHSHIAHSVLN
ncbi:hypothetical protein TYRP_012070 [Tyrophagus putrescentiae]|nr:hypothetical protein TYRP_012070 [Tyrophagus putrescentiae]